MVGVDDRQLRLQDRLGRCFASHASLGAVIPSELGRHGAQYAQGANVSFQDFPKPLASRYMLLNGRRRMAVDVAGSRKALHGARSTTAWRVGILNASDRVELIEGRDRTECRPFGRHYAH